MHTEGETTTSPLLLRAVYALGYLAAAAFLCWRAMQIGDPWVELTTLPTFMLMSTAMLLVVLAVRTLVRPTAWDEGPS